MNHKRIGSSMILIALLLQVFAVGMTFAQSSLSTFYLMSGVYPGAPTYTVWKESTTYYAKDINGQIDYSSTNASYIINSIANSYTSIAFVGASYDIDSTLRINYNSISFIGSQRGAVIFNWVGAVGGSVVATSETPYIYDFTIENIEIDTNDNANGIYLNPSLRFTIRDVNIHGTSISNDYSGIILDATYGNVGWGVIDNVFLDYVGYGINMFGTDASHVVADVNIGTIMGTNIKYNGLRFAEWVDTIDVDYAYFEAGANNASGAIFNDGADPNADNGVYNIHISRIIFDNWSFSGTRTIYVNNVKQLIIDSAYKGNATDTLGTISGYATGLYIVQQGQASGSNFIIIYYRNLTETEP